LAVRLTVEPLALALTGEEEFPLMEDARFVARELAVTVEPYDALPA